jgi:DNA repair protein SbcD/Mre11
MDAGDPSRPGSCGCAVKNLSFAFDSGAGKWGCALPLKLLHTADLHIGMTFSSRGYPEEVRRQLIEARFEALARLVERANAEQCRLLVVAGDLFHRTNMAAGAVARVVKILARFAGCAAVLPGNHDYYEPYGTLWKEFRDGAFDGLVLLAEPRPYPLHDHGIEAVLYPAPCDRKHSPQNRLGWIGDLRVRPGGRWHIGVAHGAVQGVSPDFNEQYFPMAPAELAGLKLDHWCLGHTHVRFPDLAEAGRQPFFYSGTPEPDGFDCRHGGQAWLAELDDAGGARCLSVETGRFRFREVERQVRDAACLAALRDELAAGGGNTLVKLKLSGTLPEEEYQSRGAWFAALREALLYLERDDGDLTVELTPAVIAARYPAGSFPYRLLERLAERGDREALQLAYRLIGEVKR